MKIIALIGMTCSGKTTVYNKLINEHNFKPIKETTCRPKRSSDADSQQYNFIDYNSYMNLKQEGKIIAISQFQVADGGIYRYGYSSDILNSLEQGQTYILQANHQSLPQLKELFGDKLIDVKIYRDKNEVFKTLIDTKRGDSVYELLDRVKRDETHYKSIKTKICIHNENIEDTINTILSLVGE